jgi:hypothetical protein
MSAITNAGKSYPIIGENSIGKTRYQEVCNKHKIINPKINPFLWKKSLTTQRVSDLFRSKQRLKGHVEQIQGELNRFKKVDGLNSKTVIQLVEIEKTLFKTIKKVKEKADFKLDGSLFLIFNLTHNRLYI